MRIMKKLMLACKGKLRETGEAVANTQNIRVLSEVLKEAQDSLNESTKLQVSLMADIKLFEDKTTHLKAKIEHNKDEIKKCLVQDQQALATEIAEHVAELTNEYNSDQAQLQQLMQTEETLSNDRKKASRDINRLKRQIAAIKARDQLNKTRRLAGTLSAPKGHYFSETKDLIAEINERQRHEAASIDAAELLAEQDSALDVSAINNDTFNDVPQINADDILAELDRPTA